MRLETIVIHISAVSCVLFSFASFLYVNNNSLDLNNIIFTWISKLNYKAELNFVIMIIHKTLSIRLLLFMMK